MARTMGAFSYGLVSQRQYRNAQVRVFAHAGLAASRAANLAIASLVPLCITIRLLCKMNCSSE